jgi:phosphate starvation-inducible PhoH-like protein
MAKKSAQPKVADKSPKVFQREKISYELNIRERDDLTEKQIEILKTAINKDTKAIWIDGIYGSGKTFLAVLASLKLLSQKKIDQIIYIRNPVESSTTGKVGFLKGELSEKMSPYASIVYDKLDELLPQGQIEMLKMEERVDAIPLGFCRGKSWNCKAIIVDEASSMSADDLTLLLTRCGEFTKIFLVGDSHHQNDIGAKAGFRKLFDVFNDQESKDNGVFCYELQEKTDIVRSGFVRFVLEKLGAFK